MDTLDNILSGQGDALSEAPTEEVTQAAPVDDGGNQPQEQQVQAEADGAEPQGQKTVPHEALHAEKQKVKRYTEEVSSLRQEIADRDAAWERRIATLLETQKPKPEPQQRPDWFENPDAAAQHAFQQNADPHFQRINQTLMANAQIVAGIKHGEDKVKAADAAFSEAVKAQSIDPADYHRVLSSPNIFDAAVQWHQRQLAQAEIGDDPTAFKAKVEAEILAKYGIQPGTQQQAQPGQQAAPAVMPSNIAGARNVGSRSGPAWSGPPSLQDIFARK